MVCRIICSSASAISRSIICICARSRALRYRILRIMVLARCDAPDAYLGVGFYYPKVNDGYSDCLLAVPSLNHLRDSSQPESFPRPEVHSILVVVSRHNFTVLLQAPQSMRPRRAVWLLAEYSTEVLRRSTTTFGQPRLIPIITFPRASYSFCAIVKRSSTNATPFLSPITTTLYCSSLMAYAFWGFTFALTLFGCTSPSSVARRIARHRRPYCVRMACFSIIFQRNTRCVGFSQMLLILDVVNAFMVCVFV